MKYKELEISLQVDGRTLEEYETTVNETEKTVTCWVASEAGKEFLIMRRNWTLSQGMSIRTWVDGRKMHTNSSLAPGQSRPMHGQRVGNRSVLPFKFSDLQTTEEDGISERLDALGAIELRILRASESRAHKQHMSTKRKVEEFGPVNERSKKAGAHCVTFGKERKATERVSFVKVTSLDTEDRPYCRFLFRYRSRDMLLAQGVIPSPPLPANAQAAAAPGSKRRRSDADSRDARPSASNTKRPRHIPDHGRTEVKEDPEDCAPVNDGDAVLEAQLATMAARMEKIRAKLNKSKTRAVKHEPTSAEYGEVIDLTSD